MLDITINAHTQTDIFDFLPQSSTMVIPSSVKKVETSLSLPDYSDIPFIERLDLLSQMQALIKSGTLIQSDKYLRLWLNRKPFVEKDLLQDLYRVRAVTWSDSALFLQIYLTGGRDMSTEEFLNRCDALGAYTKSSWARYFEDKSITPSILMDLFKIEEHVAYVECAKGTKEECELALHLLIDWNRNHIASLAEMQADSSLDFIRIKRKKGEIESTKCMNGECVAQIILSRENAF
ncbi:hypothetical protein [Sulfurospirillum multivorans]|uniref:Uncharacterized protein n=2 Tax=Sulfurospirillum multivorans TaxID=66821 RepID=A0AA86E2T9_SULMK|nr:hypothetical protein [Sulfurospirillum multivorans]AHJ13092.1 hypothetical protein SMUL_1837 [Sulfurospirillum multivorans DSM 12446]QEH06580.1 hypothetical protein SMN_1815 [Sulfurospirillum multivorans]